MQLQSLFGFLGKGAEASPEDGAAPVAAAGSPGASKFSGLLQTAFGLAPSAGEASTGLGAAQRAGSTSSLVGASGDNADGQPLASDAVDDAITARLQEILARSNEMVAAKAKGGAPEPIRRVAAHTQDATTRGEGQAPDNPATALVDAETATEQSVPTPPDGIAGAKEETTTRHEKSDPPSRAASTLAAAQNPVAAGDTKAKAEASTDDGAKRQHLVADDIAASTKGGADPHAGKGATHLAAPLRQSSTVDASAGARQEGAAAGGRQAALATDDGPHAATTTDEAVASQHEHVRPGAPVLDEAGSHGPAQADLSALKGSPMTPEQTSGMGNPSPAATRTEQTSTTKSAPTGTPSPNSATRTETAKAQHANGRSTAVTGDGAATADTGTEDSANVGVNPSGARQTQQEAPAPAGDTGRPAAPAADAHVPASASPAPESAHSRSPGEHVIELEQQSETVQHAPTMEASKQQEAAALGQAGRVGAQAPASTQPLRTEHRATGGSEPAPQPTPPARAGLAMDETPAPDVVRSTAPDTSSHRAEATKPDAPRQVHPSSDVSTARSAKPEVAARVQRVFTEHAAAPKASAQATPSAADGTKTDVAAPQANAVPDPATPKESATASPAAADRPMPAASKATDATPRETNPRAAHTATEHSGRSGSHQRHHAGGHGGHSSGQSQQQPSAADVRTQQPGGQNDTPAPFDDALDSQSKVTGTSPAKTPEGGTATDPMQTPLASTTDRAAPAAARSVHAGHNGGARSAHSPAWLRAAIHKGVSSMPLAETWKAVEMQLEDGDGTMTVRARRDDDKLAISIQFSDAGIRAAAQANLHRLQDLLSAQYDANVELSLTSDNASGEGQTHDQQGGGDVRRGGQTAGGIETASDGPGRAQRAAWLGATNEWVG